VEQVIFKYPLPLYRIISQFISSIFLFVKLRTTRQISMSTYFWVNNNLWFLTEMILFYDRIKTDFMTFYEFLTFYDSSHFLLGHITHEQRMKVGVIHFTCETQYLWFGLSYLYQIFDRPSPHFSQKYLKNMEMPKIITNLEL
jgi:hypothetical protein